LNEDDVELWQNILELTANKEWASLRELVEEMRNQFESRMFAADSWEEFLESRGQYRMLNHLLNLRETAKEMLREEETTDEE